ncbi:hypothetical protein Tco_1185314 [Tanacetum coccineum]
MKILSVHLEITPNLAMRAIETPLSSSMGTMWCLCDPTPSDSLDLNVANRERTGLRRTAILWNDILMFQQHQGESLSKAWTRKLHDRNTKESWALSEDLALYDSESWNDPRDFAKPVKAISLPQYVLSTSDRRFIELKNQVQCLMEAHLAPKSSSQVNKIDSSCEICSSPHDTQYCMENPKQAFVEYASSRTDEVGGKWYTFKP